MVKIKNILSTWFPSQERKKELKEEKQWREHVEYMEGVNARIRQHAENRINFYNAVAERESDIHNYKLGHQWKEKEIKKLFPYPNKYAYGYPWGMWN